MSREPPQKHALLAQLSAIAGGAPPTWLFEVRWKRSSGGMGRDFFPVRDVDRAARAIVNRGQLTDVFVGALPRVRRSGSAQDVERGWTLFVDCDSDESVERLRAFRPKPSLVLRSGSGGRHGYWPLRQAIPASWIKPATRRLAHHLGGDLAAAEPARVLRPAGSLNFKHAPPRRVVCTRLEFDAFTVREIVGGLPDPDAPPPNRRRVARPSDDAAAVAGLACTVRNAQPGNRNNALYWAACRARDDGLDARERLCHAALDAGLSESETAATLASALDRSEAA